MAGVDFRLTISTIRAAPAWLDLPAQFLQQSFIANDEQRLAWRFQQVEKCAARRTRVDSAAIGQELHVAAPRPSLRIDEHRTEPSERERWREARKSRIHDAADRRGRAARRARSAYSGVRYIRPPPFDAMESPATAGHRRPTVEAGARSDRSSRQPRESYRSFSTASGHLAIWLSGYLIIAGRAGAREFRRACA